MADRFPLILNTSANQIQEIASGDTLDLTGSNINGVGIITVTTIDCNGDLDVDGHINFDNLSIAGVSTFSGAITANGSIDLNSDLDVDGHTNLDNLSVAGVSTFSNNVHVGTGVTIETNGQATFVGVVTFGSGSTTIDNNVVNVGTALTLGHTQGVQFHTQNLHSAGFEVNQINASGIITASGVVTPNVDVDDFISVGSNIHLGNAGIITASSYRGDGSQLTGITGTTINNNADNRIITGSGTANTLNGEANLTFNGTDLAISEGGTLKIGTSANLEITSISGNKARIQSQQEDLYIETAASKSIILKTNRNGTYAGWTIETDGDFVPSGHKTCDIGSSSKYVDQSYLADINCEHIAITGNIIRTSTGGNIGSSSYKFSNVYATNFYGSVSLTGGAAANITALSDGSTITVDFDTACHHSVTLGGNRTLSGTNSGTHVGQSGSIFITQDGTGSRTLAFDSAYKFAGGTAPTLSTAANAIDRIDYIIKASGVIQAVITLDVK